MAPGRLTPDNRFFSILWLDTERDLDVSDEI